jgi:predicted esterase
MPMPSWHDIVSLTAIDNEEFRGLGESLTTIKNIVEHESKELGSGNKIFLGGFSQGGALSLYTGLQSTLPLAGIISLSGYLPVKTTSDVNAIVSENGKNIPILMCHGESDEVVQFNIGKRSMEKIRTIKNNIEWKTYKNMGHHSSEEEMRDVKTFIKKHL